MSNQITLGSPKTLSATGGNSVSLLKNRILGGLLQEVREVMTVKKYKVLEWELNEPDYQWLCYFAEKMEWNTEGDVEKAMKWVMKKRYKESTVENGNFVKLNIGGYDLTWDKSLKDHKIKGEIN